MAAFFGSINNVLNAYYGPAPALGLEKTEVTKVDGWLHFAWKQVSGGKSVVTHITMQVKVHNSNCDSYYGEDKKITGSPVLGRMAREDFLKEMTLKVQLEKLWQEP